MLLSDVTERLMLMGVKLGYTGKELRDFVVEQREAADREENDR